MKKSDKKLLAASALIGATIIGAGAVLSADDLNDDTREVYSSSVSCFYPEDLDSVGDDEMTLTDVEYVGINFSSDFDPTDVPDITLNGNGVTYFALPGYPTTTQDHDTYYVEFLAEQPRKGDYTLDVDGVLAKVNLGEKYELCKTPRP